MVRPTPLATAAAARADLAVVHQHGPGSAARWPRRGHPDLVVPTADGRMPLLVQHQAGRVVEVASGTALAVVAAVTVAVEPETRVERGDDAAPRQRWCRDVGACQAPPGRGNRAAVGRAPGSGPATSRPPRTRCAGRLAAARRPAQRVGLAPSPRSATGPRRAAALRPRPPDGRRRGQIVDRGTARPVGEGDRTARDRDASGRRAADLGLVVLRTAAVSSQVTMPPRPWSRPHSASRADVESVPGAVSVPPTDQPTTKRNARTASSTPRTTHRVGVVRLVATRTGMVSGSSVGHSSLVMAVSTPFFASGTCIPSTTL